LTDVRCWHTENGVTAIFCYACFPEKWIEWMAAAAQLRSGAASDKVAQRDDH
jgi:hypothetical protein